MASLFLSAERRLSCPWRVDPFLQRFKVGKSVTSVCLTDHSKKLRGEGRSCLWYQASRTPLGRSRSRAQEWRRRLQRRPAIFCSLEYCSRSIKRKEQGSGNKDDLRQRTSLYMKMGISFVSE